jgi:DNA-binding transcriptional MocR family regulator
MVELGPGYPDPTLLPIDLMRHCAGRALDRWGPQALGYGADAGPAELRRMLAARVAIADGARCRDANVLVTAGTSAALGQLAIRMAREGRLLLTESLTYDLGRKIFQEYGVRARAVPGPPDDLDIEAVRRAALRAERVSGRPPAVYLISTFHNPTGRVLSQARRIELMALAERLGLLVIDDLAYVDLSFGPPPPPPLHRWADDADRVVTLYSFAKCLAPGVRVGWLVSGERTVTELAAEAVRRSGGGPNHLTVMAVSIACLEGHLDDRIAWLRGQLRLRRDALAVGLTGLPDGFRPTMPDGGFFTWVSLPAGVDDRRLLRVAQARGVSFARGRRFGATARGVRLCFAAAGPDELRRGGARLRAAVTE